MKKIMLMTGALSLVVGCETPLKPSRPATVAPTRVQTATVAPTRVQNGNLSVEIASEKEISKNTMVELERLTKEKTWSSHRADMSVYPTTQEPVDSYRPIYKVDETHKVSATGYGWSEADAIKSAIYNCCISNKCDYIAAAHRIVKVSSKVMDHNKVPYYEVVVTGFPAVLTSVQTIKVAFYEEQPDGTLKSVEAPEHKYIYSTNRTGHVTGKWYQIPFGDGAKKSANLESENVVIRPVTKVKSISRQESESDLTRTIVQGMSNGAAVGAVKSEVSTTKSSEQVIQENSERKTQKPETYGKLKTITTKAK